MREAGSFFFSGSFCDPRTSRPVTPGSSSESDLTWCG